MVDSTLLDLAKRYALKKKPSEEESEALYKAAEDMRMVILHLDALIKGVSIFHPWNKNPQRTLVNDAIHSFRAGAKHLLHQLKRPYDMNEVKGLLPELNRLTKNLVDLDEEIKQELAGALMLRRKKRRLEESNQLIESVLS